MSFPIPLSSFTRKPLYRCLQQAYASGSLQLVKRLQALLALAPGQNVHEVAERLARGEQTVGDYRHAFLIHGMARWVYQAPPGRPSTRTPTQRQQRAEWIKARPPDCGSTSGCWNTPRIPDLLARHVGVMYPPPSIATLLHNMGFSSQKARFVSDHLHEAKRLEGRPTRWPKILRQATQRKALWLFGDAASLAQWGSLRYTWALSGQQPEVPTSGKRKAYKRLGLMDYCSGQVCDKAQTGRFNSESDAAFRLDVLSHPQQHVIVIHDGAR